MERIKQISLAFSGIIIYSSLLTVLPLLFGSYIAAKIVSLIFVSILGALYSNKVLNEPLVTAKLLPSRRFWLTALFVVILFAVVSFFTSQFLLIYYTDEAFLASQAYTAQLSPPEQILSLLVSILLTPIGEEIIFRGFMFRQFAKINRIFGLVMSSTVFAIWHGTAIHLYTALIGGFVLGCIYDKTQNIRFSIAAHSLFNGLTVLLSVIFGYIYLASVWIIVLNVLLLFAIIVLFLTRNPNVPQNFTTKCDKIRRQQ